MDQVYGTEPRGGFAFSKTPNIVGWFDIRNGWGLFTDKRQANRFIKGLSEKKVDTASATAG